MQAAMNSFDLPDSTINALRTRSAVALTPSDCRVALRESDGTVESAFAWLLKNKIIERLATQYDSTALTDGAALRALR